MRRAIAAVCVGSALLFPAAGAFAQNVAGSAPQTSTGASGQQHYDLNVYPNIAGTGAFDLNPAPVQSGPPGTVTMSSTSPPAAYSFKDLLANSHGYVSTTVSSRGGYEVAGMVSMPIVPGKVDLDLGAGTGQLPSFRGEGKHANLTYDSYYAGLHVHPTDDFDATIAISGLRLHGPDTYAYSPFGAP